MSRPRKPARLWKRHDTKRDREKGTQNFQWVILDDGKQIGTGCRGDVSGKSAEEALARYISSKLELPVAPQPPENISVSLVLAHYLENLREDIEAPERQAYAVKRLSPFWSTKSCADIHKDTCSEYAKSRTSSSTARRELGVLTAALNVALEAKILRSVPHVKLPKKGKPRPAWLTRDELAALLRELKRRKKTRHAARLVICQYYGGSRPRAAAKSTWKQRPDGPWIDLDAGIWWRSGDDEASTVKARRPHGIPRPLLSFLRMWKKRYGGTYVVEHPRNPGKPVMDIGNALATAAKNAGIEKHVTPHTLKHTAITLAIQSGMSAEDASDYFSTSIETIQSTYWHHSPHHQKHAVAAMSAPGKRSNVSQ